MQTSLSTLNAYYGLVRPLREHLAAILRDHGDVNASIVLGELSQAYEDLLDTCVVAIHAAPEKWPVYVPSPPMMVMKEILDRALVALFYKRGSARVDNLLALGFRRTRDTDTNHSWGGNRSGVNSIFVNTLHTALQAPAWEELLQRIGADAMMHLLTECSIYVRLPNDCLCQLTGRPLVFQKIPPLPPATTSTTRTTHRITKRKANFTLEERPFKRARAEAVAGDKSAPQEPPPTKAVPERSPADVIFARARILYTRPVRVPASDNLIVGLPPTHILHRLRPSYHRPVKPKAGTHVEPDAKKQAADARHLAKYVFARQFGLPHVFQPAENAGMWKYPDFTDRERDIAAKGTCATPKRVKPALQMCEQMLWFHAKCGYKPLLDQVCPSKLGKAESEREAIDSSVILEMMSEQSIYMSQDRLDGDGDVSMADVTASTVRPDPKLQERKNKPRFAEFACSVGEVWRYVVVVTDAVIPHAFWGSKENKKIVLEHVKTFISGRRFDSLSLHHVFQGIKHTDIAWLGPASQRVVPSDAAKRLALLADFVFWFVDGFVGALLRTTFYATESGAFRNRVLFFRHDDWAALCAPLLARLAAGTFRKLAPAQAQELLRQRRLGFSFVRLLPKETGVRPIVNLRRRRPVQNAPFAKAEQSINQVLQAAFQILTYEKANSSGMLGGSILGGNELYAKLKAFKARLLTKKTSGVFPKLYFVKVDVQACFDSITQDKLLSILHKILSEDGYLIQRFGEVMPAAGKIRRTLVRRAVPDYDHPDFLAYATSLAATLRHTIFVDQVMYSTTAREEALHLLEEHITENVVKIGNDYYQQVIGIPQGSIMSSLLCSFFYGDLEHTHFAHLLADPESMLVRLIDDYMLVTTDLDKARRFLDVMSRGHPEYGCFIAREKTMANFDHRSELLDIVAHQQAGFPWCGYLINVRDLSVSVDYSRFHHEDYLQDSITVNLGRSPGTAFAQKMLQFAKHRSHIIFCDTQLSSVDTVYRNIHQNFLLAAAKMHRYIRAWKIIPWNRTSFLLDVIHQTIHYAYASIRSHAAGSSVRYTGVQVECSVREDHVLWLGVHAFHAALSKKPTQYRKIGKALATELDRPSAKRLRKKHQALIKETHTLLAQLSF